MKPVVSYQSPVASYQSPTLTFQTQPTDQSEHSTSRLERYELYDAMYRGEHWQGLPTPGEKRLTLNYCRVFVNKVASYLLGKAVTIGVPDSPEVEDYLKKTADYNDLAGLDLDTAIAAGVKGDGCYTVRWDPLASMPIVTAVDPAGVEARYRANDQKTLTWLRQTYWTTPSDLTERQQLVFIASSGQLPDLTKPIRVSEEWTPQTWQLMTGDALLDAGNNPYNEIPYILFPNLKLPGEFWGDGDLADLVTLQRELNSRVSTFSQILELMGSPVVIIENVTEDDTQQLRLGPGELWNLPKDARAYILSLLQAGAVDAQVRHLEMIYKAMYDVAETPKLAFGDAGGGQPVSGTGLEIELQPLLHKLARKRAILTSAYLRRARLIIRIAQLNGALPKLATGNWQLTTVWPAVLPQDRAAIVTQEVALVSSGIHPPTKAMQALGDDNPEEIFTAVIAEGKKLMAIGKAIAKQAPIGALPAIQSGVG